MMYSSLFLDLDGTLLDFTKAESMAAAKVLSIHGLPSDSKTVKLYSKINQSYWEKFERGEIPKSDIFEGRFKTLAEKLGITADTKAISDDYFIFLSEGYYTIDGAFELLRFLKEKGYKLYATTNGVARTQFKRIEKSGIDAYFDKVFVSEEVGFQKPDKRYFEYVIDHIPEKDKHHMLIIGDSQTSDILGGINSGIDTCWYNPFSASPKYKSTYEIARLEELKNLL